MIEEFWNKYLSFLEPEHPHQSLPVPESWSFGNSKRMANELGQLVLSGKKTATLSRYLGEDLGQELGLSIIMDEEGAPLCLIETYEVLIQKFCEVTASFAAGEGEGDSSLEYWEFFERESQTAGYELSEEMLVCCSRFKLIYPLPSKPSSAWRMSLHFAFNDRCFLA